MFVVGVAGQAQMGKDTLADRLQEKLNEIVKGGVSQIDLAVIWERAAFAANVKKVFCDTFGVDLAFVEKWKIIPEPPPGFDMTMRQALQFIGDGFRKIKSTIWLDLAFRDQTKPKIISDVRYVNEFLRVKKEGGINILVGRPDKINDDPNGSEAQIRPYIEWCLNNLDPNKKFVQQQELHDKIKMVKCLAGSNCLLPENMESFDAFVRNDGTKDDLLSIIDEQVLPFVNHYVFEFPSTEGEEKGPKCLISS